MLYKEDGYTVQPLKPEGEYTIDKVTEANGDIYYDVYDKEENLQNTFDSAAKARAWAKMMSE